MGAFADKVAAAAPPRPGSRFAEALRREGVQLTSELRRILALPRRKLDLFCEDHDLTDLYALPGSSARLRPVQSLALLEAERAEGLVGAIGVGHGKSLLALLLPDALRAERAVLLVPPELKRQLVERDLPYYSERFELPLSRIAGILTYSDLSRAAPSASDLPSWWRWTAHLSAAVACPLTVLRPDAVICDEAHRLRRRESARTRRFLRFARANPSCKFAFLSGSFSKGSISDLGEFGELALRSRSPLPGDWRQRAAWAEALDPPRPGRARAAAGALTLFCRKGEEPVDGVARRIAETPGWAQTPATSHDGALYVRSRRVAPPPAVEEALKVVRDWWEVPPFGSRILEELPDGVSAHRAARQLGAGFAYGWEWPGGEPDREWLAAKSAWSRAVRAKLRSGSVRGMDSELLLARAAEAGRWVSEAWPAWRAARGRYPSAGPPKRAEWLSSFLVDAAVAWAREVREGVIWCRHVALAEEVARAGGFPLFGEGADAGVTDPKQDPVIVCTLAQSEGKNLQAWSRALVTTPSSSSDRWEQLLGRLHRPGQRADEVWVDVLVATREDEAALAAAVANADHTRRLQGEQKLLLAARVDW